MMNVHHLLSPVGEPPTSLCIAMWRMKVSVFIQSIENILTNTMFGCLIRVWFVMQALNCIGVRNKILKFFSGILNLIEYQDDFC